MKVALLLSEEFANPPQLKEAVKLLYWKNNSWAGKMEFVAVPKSTSNVAILHNLAFGWMAPLTTIYPAYTKEGGKSVSSWDFDALLGGVDALLVFSRGEEPDLQEAIRQARLRNITVHPFAEKILVPPVTVTTLPSNEEPNYEF